MEEQKHKKEEESCNTGIYMMKKLWRQIMNNLAIPQHLSYSNMYIYIYEYVCTNTYK